MNAIPIELCQEDRARIDKVIELLTLSTGQEPETAPQVSKADIQQKVIQLSAAGKKAQVREIVTAVATKVSDIPEDKLADVWGKLTALEVAEDA